MYPLRMNEDSPDTVLDDDGLNALLDRPFTELSVDELMAMKAAYAARGIRVYNSLPPEVWVPLGTASLYAHFYLKSFMETLGKRHAEAVTDPARIRKKVKKTEAKVGLPGGEPMVLLAEGMSEEAWLALLDLDEAADDLHGKLLRWDSRDSAWRPADDK